MRNDLNSELRDVPPGGASRHPLPRRPASRQATSAAVTSLPATSLDDRALGAYLGYAIGDAMGASVAGMTPGEIILKYGALSRMIGGGWLGLKAGQVTDDTEMTLCVGRALAAAQGWHLKGVCTALADWLKGAPVDVGAACRRGIRRFLIEGTVQATEHPSHADAGACTRNLPVALATLGNARALVLWSKEQCHITHNHPFADAVTIALGQMVHALVGSGDVTAAGDVVRALIREHPELAFRSYRGPCTADIVDLVRTVLHHYFEAQSFRDCIIATINAGGEADTAGALAGMLAGATFGAASIPKEWLRRLDPVVADEIRAQVPALLHIAGVMGAGAGAAAQ